MNMYMLALIQLHVHDCTCIYHGRSALSFHDYTFKFELRCSDL